MGNQIILHQTPVSELSDLIRNAVKEELKEIRISEPQQPKFYTRVEVAEMLGVTLPTLHQWTKQGVIQGARIGHSVRYRLSDVEDALKKTRTPHPNSREYRAR